LDGGEFGPGRSCGLKGLQFQQRQCSIFQSQNIFFHVGGKDATPFLFVFLLLVFVFGVVAARPRVGIAALSP
jgi:hypothetical protein